MAARYQADRILRNTFYAQTGAIVLASIAQSIGQVTDGLVIGSMRHTDSMAAFGIVNPLMIAFVFSGAIVAAGSRNRFTKLVGAGKLDQARSLFSLSCVLAIAGAVIAAAILLVFSTPVTVMLGASSDLAGLLPKARGYLIGMLVGLPAMNGMQILSAYLPIDNRWRLPVIASATMAALNIALDLAAVYVLKGDTFEIGLATSISYYIAFAVLLTHFRNEGSLLRFSIHGLPWRETGTIIAQGLPKGVRLASGVIRSVILNLILASTASATAIAAYAAHRQVADFLNPLVIGMADIVVLLAALLVGEENRPELERLMSISTQASLSVTIPIAILVWGFAPQIASLFNAADAQALTYSTNAVRAFALGLPLYGINLIYAGHLEGTGRIGVALIASFFLEAGFIVLAAFLFTRWLGANAVWYAFPFAQFLMFAFYEVVIEIATRRLGIPRDDGWGMLLLLPPSFDVPPEDRMDKTVTTAAEVADLSRAVWEFCDAHGCDERRRYLLSLSVEEMAGNVIEHGFTKDARPHSMNVRVLKKGDSYILRVRDDCVVFDPIKRMALFDDDDPSHHIGLRMVYRTAREMRYTCVLRLNNLLIKL